jgi:hypothetical protein
MSDAIQEGRRLLQEATERPWRVEERGWADSETGILGVTDKDGCPTHAAEGRAEWVHVAWGSKRLDFCCWDCALAYGAQLEPIEVVR